MEKYLVFCIILALKFDKIYSGIPSRSASNNLVKQSTPVLKCYNCIHKKIGNATGQDDQGQCVILPCMDENDVQASMEAQEAPFPEFDEPSEPVELHSESLLKSYPKFACVKADGFWHGHQITAKGCVPLRLGVLGCKNVSSHNHSQTSQTSFSGEVCLCAEMGTNGSNPCNGAFEPDTTIRTTEFSSATNAGSAQSSAGLESSASSTEYQIATFHPREGSHIGHNFAEMAESVKEMRPPHTFRKVHHQRRGPRYRSPGFEETSAAPASKHLHLEFIMLAALLVAAVQLQFKQ